MSEYLVSNKGLITKQSPLAIPPESSDCIVNFDVNELGRLSKRNGTVYRDFISARLYFVKRIRDIELMLVVYNTGVYVYNQSLDTLLYSIINLYDQADVVDFTAANVDTSEFFSAVIFASNCNPVQVFFQEVQFELLQNATTVTLDLSDWTISRVKAFNGNNLLSFTYTYDALTELYTLTFAGVGEDRVITLLHYGYGVWFTAQYYFGEELSRSLSRGTTTIEQVPETLLTELDKDNQAHIKLYSSSNSTYNITQQPRYYNDVAFSDGQSYTYSPTEYITYSPYFITFGQPVYERRFDLTIENVNVADNTIRYNLHGVQDGMTVIFSNEAPGGVALGTPYVVEASTADSFKLSGVTITDTYSTSRASLDVYAYMISPTGTLSIATTVVPAPRPYKLYSNVLLPSGLVSGETYYLTSTGSSVQLFFDQSGQYPINLVRFKTLQFESTDVNITTNQITINGHGWANGIPVAIIDSTDLPGGLTLNQVYYIVVEDANTIKLASSPLLNNVIDITTIGSSTYTLTEAWGIWHLEPDYISGSFQVVNNKSITMLRARSLDLGRVDSSIVVRVDDTVWTRNTSGVKAANTYYISDEDFNILTGAYNEDAYINFESTPGTGLSRTSFVQLINTRKFVNMHSSFAAGTTYNSYTSLNTVITIYGFSDRFSESRQPQAVATVQNRLLLSNANILTCSNTSDSFVKNQFYNNFIVDDRLTGELTQQFEIVLSDISSVVVMFEYQNSLLVFTRTAVYRVVNLTYNQFNVVQVAKHGIPSKNCVTRLHSLIIYYNEYGVYTLNIDVQETYYASELSAVISNRLNKCTPALLEFDRQNDLLLVVSECIFVLNTRANTWTEYKFAWEHKIVSSFVINNELSFVDAAISATYTFRNVGYDLLRTYENVSADVLTYADGTLSLNGSPLLLAINLTDEVFNTVPFAEDYYTDSNTLLSIDKLRHNYKDFSVDTFYSFRRKSVAFQVDSFTLNQIPEGTWDVVEYGYGIDAVFLTASIKAQQLSFNNRVIYAEVVFELVGDDEATVGVIYGNDNKPVILTEAISKVDSTDKAVFTVLKESLQGVSSSYRLLVISRKQYNTVYSGMSFLEQEGSPMYRSGGN